MCLVVLLYPPPHLIPEERTGPLAQGGTHLLKSDDKDIARGFCEWEDRGAQWGRLVQKATSQT